MKTKMLEIRDRATFIPALAIKIALGEIPEQDWLLSRAGYGIVPCVLLVDPRGNGRAVADPYDWKCRTWTVAHDYIEKNFDSLNDDVVDVEFILGETDRKKKSERADTIDKDGKYVVSYEDKHE